MQIVDKLRGRVREYDMRWHNFLLDMGRQKSAPTPSGLETYDEILKHAQARSDISDHLPILFAESLPVQPSLIVELGVRGGESTFAFERVAALCGSKLVSVDIDDCIKASTYPEWQFVKSDDIAFAAHFPEWCRERGIVASIDILFIDTSHEFDHTVQELVHWFPFLSDHAKVFFHDTNMKRVFLRRDGSKGIGWENNRGVIAAIEQYLGTTFHENRDFVAFADGWMVKHHAHCSGLTILERWRHATSKPSRGGAATRFQAR
jgi:cephalosporin hydroxylase